MGELEGRSRRLARRAARLEEDAELRKQAEQRAKEREAERVLREALRNVSTEELRAMGEHFERPGPEEWTEQDTPLMLRLLELMEEVRKGEEGRGFPWQEQIRKEQEHDHEPAE